MKKSLSFVLGICPGFLFFAACLMWCKTIEASPGPYDNVAIVAHSIAWPYNAQTYGNDSFRQGSREEDDSDSMLLSLVDKYGSLRFPKGFLFGVAHAAYQYEGNRLSPSKSKLFGLGWSLWDVFCEKGSWLNPSGNNISEILPTKQFTKPNGSEAIQGYDSKRYLEDIALAKKLGIKVLRLSISWPRLFPKRGMAQPDPRAINYYVRVLKALKSQGIEVYITLYHWDLPAWLYNFGDPKVPSIQKTYGWLDPNDAKDNLTILEYQKYADACFRAFGKYTPYFATFNEPLTFTNSGVYFGNHAPGKAGFEVLRKMHPKYYGHSAQETDRRLNYLMAGNIIKAHFIAYKTFENHRLAITQHNRDKTAMLGLVINADWAEPYRIIKNADGKLEYHPEDIQASKRHMDFALGWWLEPIMFGHWPKTMRRFVAGRLPNFEADHSCLSSEGRPKECQKKNLILKNYILEGGALDYIALNHYSGYFVADLNFAKHNLQFTVQKNAIPPDQYGVTPNKIQSGWASDQQTFITQFRYQKFGNTGRFAAQDKSRVYVIGRAGAQPWLRHTYFSYYKLLLFINKYYLDSTRKTKQGVPFSNLGIYLTENGTSLYRESQKPPTEQSNDDERIEFIKGNLASVWFAIQKGVNVKSYIYWSLADNFEWAEGYDSRFGLVWVDYAHQFLRIPKKSYAYYREIAKNNRIIVQKK